MGNELPMNVAVEGFLDEAVVRRLLDDVGGVVGKVYVKRGNRPLRAKIAGYNNAAKRGPWLVLTDLDQGYRCAAELVADWLPGRARDMNLRVAVRAIEAWLLADRRQLASFLGVPVSRLPQDPETTLDPKGLVVDLARSSRRRDVRDALVPDPRSGRRAGPGYTSLLFEFVREEWDLDEAAHRSPSLDRCRRRLRGQTP